MLPHCDFNQATAATLYKYAQHENNTNVKYEQETEDLDVCIWIRLLEI